MLPYQASRGSSTSDWLYPERISGRKWESFSVRHCGQARQRYMPCPSYSRGAALPFQRERIVEARESRGEGIAARPKEIEVAQASGAALRQRAETKAVFDENFETLARA